MIVAVDESPVGSGKTEKQIRRAVTIPAKYLFVVERLESMTELAQRIAPLIGNHPVIIELIRGDEMARGLSVRQAVEALPDQYQAGHVIAICTHAAMMMSELSRFSGWHIIIDEVPSVLVLDEKQSKLDAHFFERNYKLENVQGEWSRVTMTDAGFEIDGSDLQQDDSHRHLRVFHQRVRDASLTNGRPVLCNLSAWSDVEREGVTWTWWSLFSITQLSAFASINFLGNNFRQSIAAKLMEAWEPELEWKPFSTVGSRPLQSKTATIRYYSNERASLTFFRSDLGKANLKKIASFIASASKGNFIWTANTDVVETIGDCFRNGTRLTPRQSGSGKFQHFDNAAIFFAAKPNPNVRSILSAVGVKDDDWIASNEHETILQFVTRTSIRDVASNAAVVIDVFSEDQATYLKSFFDDQPHISATVEYVDLDLEKRVLKTAGRPKFSPQEAKNAEIERKRLHALRSKAYRARMAENRDK